jgi:hypothetical protein
MVDDGRMQVKPAGQGWPTAPKAGQLLMDNSTMGPGDSVPSTLYSLHKRPNLKLLCPAK